MTQIILSEVMPNPKGKDTESEWVELFNPNPASVDLSGWKILTGAKSVIKLDGYTINAKSFLIIENFKTAIKNTENEIRLIDSQGTQIDKIGYKTAKDGQSLSLVQIKTGAAGTTTASSQTASAAPQTAYLWDSPTKNLPNKTFYEITGTIEKAPEIGEEFTFTLKDSSGQLYTIVFTEDFQFELLKNMLTPNTEIVILAEKAADHFNLKNYEILQASEPAPISTTKTSTSSNWEYFLLIPIFLLMLGLIYLSRSTPCPSSRYKPSGRNPLS